MSHRSVQSSAQASERRRGSPGLEDAPASAADEVQHVGFLRHHADEAAGKRFVMRQKLLSIGDDFWIETDQGDRAYKVDGKAFHLRKTFVLEDVSGDEVARIQERKLTIRDKLAIEREGETAATVHKALVGIRDRFAIDVEHGA